MNGKPLLGRGSHSPEIPEKNIFHISFVIFHNFSFVILSILRKGEAGNDLNGE
jgi:hypothetical protein